MHRIKHSSWCYFRKVIMQILHYSYFMIMNYFDLLYDIKHCVSFLFSTTHLYIKSVSSKVGLRIKAETQSTIKTVSKTNKSFFFFWDRLKKSIARKWQEEKLSSSVVENGGNNSRKSRKALMEIYGKLFSIVVRRIGNYYFPAECNFLGETLCR